MAEEDNLAEEGQINLEEVSLNTQALIDQMESLKKAGAESLAKVQAFYQANGIEPGDGLRILTSDRVDPSDQYVFLKLLSELEKAPEAIAKAYHEVDQPVAVAAPMRALNHRYRI